MSLIGRNSPCAEAKNQIGMVTNMPWSINRMPQFDPELADFAKRGILFNLGYAVEAV